MLESIDGITEQSQANDKFHVTAKELGFRLRDDSQNSAMKEGWPSGRINGQFTHAMSILYDSVDK